MPRDVLQVTVSLRQAILSSSLGRIDCMVLVVVPADVAPTGASVDVLGKLAIRNVIINLFVIVYSSFSYIPRIECDYPNRDNF